MVKAHLGREMVSGSTPVWVGCTHASSNLASISFLIWEGRIAAIASDCGRSQWEYRKFNSSTYLQNPTPLAS